jgi:hypothetical protein
MKCTNFVAYEQYGKKGKTRRVAMRPDWIAQTQKYKQFTAEPVPCTGTLKIFLNVTQGCCCHEPAELVVSFTCSECGPIEFEAQSLPTKYDLAEWINALMDTTASLSFQDTTTKGHILQERRNAAVRLLMAEKGLSDQDAYTEVMRREMQEALNAVRPKKNANK